MINISVEGTEFFYFTAGSSIPDSVAKNGRCNDFGRSLASGSDTRLVLFRSSLPPKKQLPYWLVWQDIVDLVEIDKKAVRGAVVDSDFSGAFRASLSKIACFKCSALVWALVVDAGDPYPLAPSLHQLKIKKIRPVVCPHCRESFRVLVVKIIHTEAG